MYKCKGAGLLAKLKSSVPLVDRFVELKDMCEARGPPEDATAFRTLNELKVQLRARLATGMISRSPGLKYHALGFHYVGPRIAESALAESRMVREAYGVEREILGQGPVQFVILVLAKQHGVRFDNCCLVPYKLKLISHFTKLEEVSPGCHMSLYKNTETPLDDPILDALRAGPAVTAPKAEHKWIWFAE